MIDDLATDVFCCQMQKKVLPADPVIAADGCVYDRPAIEGWFNEKSPVPRGPK